jgi:hypothetical protein
MSLMAWQRRLRPPIGVALALLAGALFLPATARASCGDYIMLGSQGQGPSASLGDMSAHTDPSRTQGPSPMRAPCSGPTCSQQSIPIAPPPATNPVEEERWAFPLGFPWFLEDNGTLVLATTAPSRSVHRPSSVYHPPR